MKFRQILKQIKGLLPETLPVGMTEFNDWVIDFKGTYNLPTQDDRTIRWILTSTIIHQLKFTNYRKSKYYFYKVLMKAAANEIAGHVFIDLKEQQKAEQQKLEATKNLTVVSNENR